MKPQLWLPLVAILAFAITVVLVLGAQELVPDHRLGVALSASVVAAAVVQHELKVRAGSNQA